MGRSLSVLFGLLLLAMTSAAGASPKTRGGGEAVIVSFDPVLGQDLTYRWEKTDERDGKTTMNWSVDRVRFEEAGNGYRLSVEPVSSGSSEKDPRKIEFMKKLEELTKKPFVLRLNEEGEIVEVERADEYWSAMTQALREVLKKPAGQVGADHAKALDAVVRMFESIPAEARLAMLTESVQPLVEFAYTEMREGEPIHATLETASPYGGTLKQHVTVSLTKVKDGFAYLTVRANVPREELRKLTTAFFNRLQNGALKPEEVAKANAAIHALKEFKMETVGDYKVSTEDGMVETYRSTRSITAADGDRQKRRVTSVSLTRIH